MNLQFLNVIFPIPRPSFRHIIQPLPEGCDIVIDEPLVRICKIHHDYFPASIDQHIPRTKIAVTKRLLQRCSINGLH